ncbi:MAG: hypothetical protein AAGA80_21015 [Cyanobacteria bacterium P01_F01_bin.143]
MITEADTLDEVIPNVSDALAALIEAYEDLNQPYCLTIKTIKGLRLA